MARQKVELPPHEYTEGATCITAESRCGSAMVRKWNDYGRHEACVWCGRCFWDSNEDGCEHRRRGKKLAAVESQAV